MRLTIRQYFTALLFIGLFLMSLRPIADPDFWWHLRTGQLITQAHAIPHSDPFSYTNQGKPWIAQEWLSELLMYGLYTLGGYGLLILVFSFIITAAFFLAYLRCPPGSRPYVAGLVLLLGALATAPTWGVRPQMLSLFFTALVLYLLNRYWQAGRLRFLLPLPLLTLLWVNLHAGYFLGLVIIAIFICGGLIEIALAEVSKRSPGDRHTLRSILILCGVLAASLLCTLVNPNGVHILLYPFQTLTSQAMQQFIQEWFSPDFHQMMWQPLAWFLLAFIGFGMIGKKSISPINMILTLSLGYAALVSARNIPLFAISAIPVLSEEIDALIRIRPAVQTPTRLLRIGMPVLLLLSLGVTGLQYRRIIEYQSESEAQVFPAAAVDWIESNHPAGNLFNTYAWGGYLIWRLYPQYLVYIDGRADVYGDAFMTGAMATYRGQIGWEQTLNTAGVHLALVEPVSGLANALRQSSAWKVVYEDKTSVLFSTR